MKNKLFRKLCVFSLVTAMLVSADGFSQVASAAKAPKISTKSVKVKVGKTKKVSVKNKPAGAKVTWKTQNKKIATVKNGKIKGVKKGKTKVICTVAYKKAGKATKKNFKIKVTVQAAAAQATKAPQVTATASAPAVTTQSPAPASQAPATQVPAPATQDPSVTEPAATATAPADVSGPTPAAGDVSVLTDEHDSANGIKTRDNGQMRQELSTLDLVNKYMGPGWNLGNQMEQSNWQGNWETVKDCETSAGNPVATQKTFDGLKSYGINTVRVPVAWSNFISTDGKYTINEDLLNRVEEIINYALNAEMYVIINIHWDGAWWGRFGAEEIDAAETPIRDEAWKKYEAIWTQISERYKEYSDHLIFEGANEELSGRLNDDYNHPEKGQTSQTGKLDEDGIYTLVNAINQKFVDIVRASGGNNKYRHLLIPGTGNESCVIGGYPSDHYKTDGTMDERYKIPDDPENTEHKKLSISVHYYDPTDYGISATSTTPWGYRDSWGTDDDYKYMQDLMGRLRKFTDQGYGIIIGECGCVKGYKDNVIDYLKELYKNAAEIGCCAVLWDEGHYFDRKKGYFAYGDVGEFFAELTGSTPNIPDKVKFSYTGIPEIPVVDNPNPKVVYTWEGEFMRHTGDPEAGPIAAERGDVFHPVNHGIGYTTSITDADGNPTEDLQVEINDEYWNIHFTTDWSKFKEPCIRVYPMANPASEGADLQLGYQETGESAVRFDVDYDQGTGAFWRDKYIKLDVENLADYPWIWVTTNTYTGASYVKIEVCDGAYNTDGTEFTK